MSIVKVKTKYQVTLPTLVRKQVRIKIGDILEAMVERGKITLTPKTIIDRRIEESFEDYKKGRSYGPFNTAKELTASLKSNMKKRAKRLKLSR